MALNTTWIFTAGGDNLQQIFEYDANGNMIYQGWAQPGAAVTDSSWRIRRMTYNGSNQITNIQWPGGSPAFVFQWSARPGYTYS